MNLQVCGSLSLSIKAWSTFHQTGDINLLPGLHPHTRPLQGITWCLVEGKREEGEVEGGRERCREGWRGVTWAVGGSGVSAGRSQPSARRQGSLAGPGGGREGNTRERRKLLHEIGKTILSKLVWWSFLSRYLV